MWQSIRTLNQDEEDEKRRDDEEWRTDVKVHQEFQWEALCSADGERRLLTPMAGGDHCSMGESS